MQRGRAPGSILERPGARSAQELPGAPRSAHESPKEPYPSKVILVLLEELYPWDFFSCIIESIRCLSKSSSPSQDGSQPNFLDDLLLYLILNQFILLYLLFPNQQLLVLINKYLEFKHDNTLKQVHTPIITTTTANNSTIKQFNFNPTKHTHISQLNTDTLI